MLSRELQQRGTCLPQTLQVDHFVVRRARLPALPDDPDPLEGQGAHGGVMAFAFGALHRVVSLGPEGMLDRLLGVLDKRLAEELGTEITPANPTLFAAALNDRGHPREAQQVIDSLPARAIGTERGGQARGIDRAGC